MTLLVHEIHSSQLRGYRRCRRMWDWRYRENWEPIKKPAPLEDGTVWHKALEVLYNPETWNLEVGELHRLAQAALLHEADTQRNEYLKRVGKYQLDEEEALDYGDRLSILRSMLVKLCRSLDREKYKPVFVEQEFSCAITDKYGRQLYCSCRDCTRTLEANDPGVRHEYAKQSQAAGSKAPGLPVVFSCRIDAGFEDREGFIFAVDHKSAAALYKPDSVIPELEDQLPSYLWCLQQNAYPVVGAILNQFRKAYPKPPKRLERMQQGRLYSVNKMQLTDYHTARQVFKNHDSRAFQHGLYNDYLSWLQAFGPEYDRQFTIFKTADHLEQVGRDIALQVQEVINQGPSVYPNPSQMNCQSCSFQLPCLIASGGGDVTDSLQENFIKSEPYYIQRRRQS